MLLKKKKILNFKITSENFKSSIFLRATKFFSFLDEIVSTGSSVSNRNQRLPSRTKIEHRSLQERSFAISRYLQILLDLLDEKEKKKMRIVESISVFSLSRDRGINQNESYTRSFSRASRATKTRRRNAKRGRNERERCRTNLINGDIDTTVLFFLPCVNIAGFIFTSLDKRPSFPPPLSFALFYFSFHCDLLLRALHLSRENSSFCKWKLFLSHSYARFSRRQRGETRRLVNMIPESDTRKPLITPKWMGLGHCGRRQVEDFYGVIWTGKQRERKREGGREEEGGRECKYREILSSLTKLHC